jgi:hypothetical protein
MIRIGSSSGLAAHGPAKLCRIGRTIVLSSAAVLGGLALVPSQAQAQYTALFIPQPTSGQPPGLITPLALNNRGQVLAQNFWGGPAPDRGLLLYSNGSSVPLAFPTGYHFVGAPYGQFLNDAGVAVGVGQMDAGTGTNFGMRPIVWKGATAGAIPLPMSLTDCAARLNMSPPPPPAQFTQEMFNVLPHGLNRAGHLLVDACNSLWVVDSAGNVVLAGPPPVVIPMVGLEPAYYTEGYGSDLNDADVVSAETGIPGFPEATHPGVLTGLSTLAPLPIDFGHAWAINNRNQVLVEVQPSGSVTADCQLVTASAVVDLGICGSPSLNNLGQVSFMTGGPQPLLRLYKDGNVVTIALPPQVPGFVVTGSPSGLNDAGQIIGFDGSTQGVVLTPAGPCAADATAQTAVRHAGLRLDAATGHYTTTVHVKNNGTTTLAAPVSVVLDGLPATASLVNVSGATSCDTPAGSAYLNLTASIAPGRTGTGTLEFIDPSGGRLRYTTRVLAGPGLR